ncbi:S9 family peptidase [Gynuella sunshinyii]|uniref:Peptidase n=1 Tax=Gynuella sunshinyii YC6258 TaxID=1445510 RepID=A0A0C5VXE5_9GAMM|nr:DPP IV N-terminal domain-containing protein [Gynuella sunshinyii]AJQ95104.1 dipeptidyl aminopeptidase/acylaminoacyl-peptidase [Gynuella sunshinyii YC6258]DAC80079.1 TPA_exp: peptidase [Gynuella sunshinyii YC6258]
MTQTEADMRKRYERAQVLENGFLTKNVAFNTTVLPNWINDTEYFWYKRDSKTGYQFRLVNSLTVSNEMAFDHQALADSLSAQTEETVDADNLPINLIEITLHPVTVTFNAFNRYWRYCDEHQTCEALDSHPAAGWVVSPDGRKAVFLRDGNLWLKDLMTGNERILTQDGQKHRVYSSSTSVYGLPEAPSVEALWSPDSRRIFTHVIDNRALNTGLPLIDYVPADGSLKPKILSPDRRVAFADDEQVECWQFLSIEVVTGEITWADYHGCPVYYPHYIGYFSGYRGWWHQDGERAYFTELARGGKTGRLVEFNTRTGATRVLIEEHSQARVVMIPTGSHFKTLYIPLPQTDELIWYSYSSGWAHLYLYDLNTGQLKHPITQGNWMVRNATRFDAIRRELIIQTAGRVPGRNPYYRDICRVNIDSGELTELLSTDHEYVVCDGRDTISGLCNGVSANGDFIVTTRSRVDQVPVTLLLDREGQTLCLLETADVSGLPENWQWPEPVMLKADDGETDIYGVIFRPSDFSPDKRYPILDCSYFFSAPIGSFSNNTLGSWMYLSAAAYAELGFITVMFNNRGNDGLRDSRFNDHQDPVLPHSHLFVRYNKADCVAGIRQLMDQYNYIDPQRIGVVETSPVPTALAGMLLYPDFYRVGVTRNSYANWRIMGSVGMTGEDNYPQLEDFAHQLKGKLLLVAGMCDAPIPVTMTFRMIEAFKKANKDVDMLILPGDSHVVSPYAVRRSWDYLVRHLANEEPPHEFELSVFWMQLAAMAEAEKLNADNGSTVPG